MALILVVEFQTQEWGRGGLFSPHSRNPERLPRRGGLRVQGLLGDGPWKGKGGMRGGDTAGTRFVTGDRTESKNSASPVNLHRLCVLL